jgi:hypothetical protein
MRLAEVARGGRRADRRARRRRARRPGFRRVTNMLLARLPFRVATEQVFLGHHFEDRPDILRHAAVDEHQAVLQACGGFPPRRRYDPGCGVGA